ncbi:hypothetical protein HZH66_005319 [Vespula vulgaris]|uniref:Uncharacterized protein n=1 Tax=Vespula vulgaris TaxID=7454 RepID=A0A834NBC9_VESVU|nr:hypothetical protein HZH66_005319 [Vespula vulgaris]
MRKLVKYFISIGGGGGGGGDGGGDDGASDLTGTCGFSREVRLGAHPMAMRWDGLIDFRNVRFLDPRNRPIFLNIAPGISIFQDIETSKPDQTRLEQNRTEQNRAGQARPSQPRAVLTD